MIPFTTAVAGVTFRDNYPQNIYRLVAGQEVALIPDPHNEYDPYACRVVAIYESTLRGEADHVAEEIGYLPKPVARKVYDYVHGIDSRGVERREAGHPIPRAFVDQVKDSYGENPGVNIRIVPHESTSQAIGRGTSRYAGERARRRETATQAASEAPDVRYDDMIAVVPPRISPERVREIAEQFEDDIHDAVNVDAFGGEFDWEIDYQDWVDTVRRIIEEYVGGLFGGGRE